MKIILKLEEYNRRLIGQQYTQLINEELSISKHVEYVANRIFNAIKSNPKITEINNIDFIGKATLELHSKDFNNSYDLRQYGEYSECEYIRDPKRVYIQNNKIYEITFIFQYKTLNDEIDNERELLSLIFHEVEHAYQDYVKLSKGIDDGKTESKDGVVQISKKNELYEFAVNNMYDNNSYLHMLCHIIYMSYKEEQDAFTHQTYSFLKQFGSNLNRDNLYFKYQRSEGYSLLHTLKNYYKKIDTWQETDIEYIYMQKTLKLYNIFFDKKNIKNLTFNTIKRFETKLNKVIGKIMQEYNITECRANRNLKFKRLLIP